MRHCCDSSLLAENLESSIESMLDRSTFTNCQHLVPTPGQTDTSLVLARYARLSWQADLLQRSPMFAHKLSVSAVGTAHTPDKWECRLQPIVRALALRIVSISSALILPL